MVTVIGTEKRQNKELESFNVLILQGDVEMIKSKEGNYYASALTCSITSTFDEVTSQALVGSELEGRIEKVECEEYEFLIPETNEKVTLSHTFVFVPDDQNEAKAA